MIGFQKIHSRASPIHDPFSYLPQFMKLHHKILGTGEPVIILHGLFGMLDNWRSIAKKLESRFQLILVDLRNHGRSPHENKMDYKIMAADIAELMKELQLDSANLIGHSMGGKVAMQFALDYPEKVKKLIIVDISPRAYPPHHFQVIKAIQSIDPAQISDRTEAETSFRNHLGNDEATIQFLLKNMTRKEDKGFAWKANMPAIVAGYEKLMDRIISDTTFSKPSLFIRGELSDSVKDEDWSGIEELFPGARLVTIPGAGHWVHADKPQAITDTILAFLEV